MARIRTIKPDFWEDEKIGTLPLGARLLFIGTWSYADDNGVLRGNPAYLKSQIFPYDDNLRVGEVKRWIDALVEARMLIPLTYRGEGYYVVRTFRSHQRIDTRYSNELIPSEELSAILSSDEHTTSARRGPGERTALEVEVDGDSGSVEGTGNTTHTVVVFPNKRVRVSDVRAAFDRLTGEWMKGYAPNLLKFRTPLTWKQFGIMISNYEIGDIARLLFDISNRPGCWKGSDSVYSVFAKYAAMDSQIRAQREALAHNGRQSSEGVLRGKADLLPVPRTTRETHPLLGDIVDAL